MNMYMIVYDAGYDEDIMEALSSLGINGYTKWSKVLGKGKKSDPKMDDGTWPGYNSSIMMIVDELREGDINRELTQLYEKLQRKGMRVYFWPVQQIL